MTYLILKTLCHHYILYLYYTFIIILCNYFSKSKDKISKIVMNICYEVGSVPILAALLRAF